MVIWTRVLLLFYPLQMLSPTYKSRSEDFKKQFKDIPADERLIVGEYMYISQQ